MLKPRETHGRSGRKERRRGQRKEGSKRGHPAGKEEARGARRRAGSKRGGTAQKGASLRRAEWFRCSPGGVGRGAKKEQKEGRRPELVAKVFMIW